LELGQGRPRAQERSLTLDDLFRADEVFITSTTRDLLPVREIRGKKLRQSGGARAALAGAFQDFLRRDLESRRTAPVHA
jgi:branched-chain amino acid aminotransferase